MKIRTKEELADLIDKDLAWRKKELSALQASVLSSNDKVLPTSLRCAVVMLYAHWEGFVKNATSYYINYVRYQKLNLNQLNNNFLAFSLKGKLNEFASTGKATIQVEFIEYILTKLNERARFSENDAIKTSNLNSGVLKEMFASIGIDSTPYELKANLIDSQLLNYRNTIAHGNFLPVDKAEYQLLHGEVFTMLEQVRTDVSNAAVLELFKKAVSPAAVAVAP
ncbi:MAG: hypothetical protein EOO06_09395 [Chitinophagaceae bacterium]|nr:MAG: hypothetical protein EOO06_09395 [Chitinophagaceae bacterium]